MALPAAVPSGPSRDDDAVPVHLVHVHGDAVHLRERLLGHDLRDGADAESAFDDERDALDVVGHLVQRALLLSPRERIQRPFGEIHDAHVVERGAGALAVLLRSAARAELNVDVSDERQLNAVIPDARCGPRPVPRRATGGGRRRIW
jgi:hypothetical protein